MDDAVTGGTVAPPSPSLYTRHATGLVRDISTLSAVALNVSFMGIAYVALAGTSIPFGFPGANPFWVALICGAVTVFPILLYGLFLTAMPRTGGDYIYVSRTLHPWLGLAANFNLTSWYLVNTAFLAFLVPVLGVSSAFLTIGVTTDSPTLTRWATDVTTKNWAFGIGAFVLILVFLSVSIRMQQTLSLMKVIFVASLVCVVAAIVLLAIHGRSDFEASVARFGASYKGVLGDAHKAGYAGYHGFDLKNTWFALPAIFTAFGYAIVTAYTGGEVRSARVSGLRGMLYSLAIAVFFAAIMFGLAARTFGNDFLGSATFLSTNGDEAYPFDVPSFFFFFVSMLTDSTVVIALIGISFVIATAATLPPSFLAATRSMFAWSFDRLIPAKISAVNERTRSPLVANTIVLGVALGYLAFIAYGPSYFTTVLFTTIAGQLLTFMVVAIAGVAFPYRRRLLYEASPIRRSIGGIPLIAAVGAIAFAVYAFMFYSLMTTDALGANSDTGKWAMLCIGLISLAIYPISYLINRRRGVDLGLTFRELPPE
jgi:basic amino acid/polyamine antiporter, APA family